jgi:hypothetical protein
MDEEKLLQLAAVVGKLKKKVSELDSKADAISKLEGPQGKQGPKGDKGNPGKDGLPGKDGRDGVDGKDGKDGKPGKDGVSVVDAYIDIDNSLVLKLSNGIEVSAGELPQTSKSKDNIYIQNTQQFALDGLPDATEDPVPEYFLVRQDGQWKKASFTYLLSWLSVANILATENGDFLTTEAGDYIIME